MRLKSLRLQNFRSFVDATVEFPPTGLVLIEGADDSSGESSGTGKTSIFLGIAYCLDILPPRFTAKSLQNWSTEEPMQVTLELELDGRPVVLARGKRTLIRIGEEIIEGAKTYGEGLAKVFGPVLPSLGALTYRPQKAGGFFLGMGPADKVEFLAGLLGLRAIEQAVEAATESAKVLKQQESEKTALLESAIASLDRIVAEQVPENIDISAFEEAVSHAEASKVKTFTLSEQLEKRANAIKAEQDALYRDSLSIQQGKLTETQQLLARLRKKEDEKNTARREEQSSIRRSLQSLNAALIRLDAHKDRIKMLKLQIGKMDANTCPTCDQSWDKAPDLRQKLLAEIALLENEISGRPVFAAQAQELEAKLSDMAEHRPNPQLESVRAIETSLKEELARATSMNNSPALKEAIRTMEQQAKVKQEAVMALEAAKSDLREAKAKKAGRDTLVANKERRLRDQQEIVNRLRPQVNDIKQRLGAEMDFVAMMGRGGFLGLIIEEVLAEIATETNSRLHQLANVDRVSINFTTETDKGKRQIQTWVSVRGHTSKFETGLSGGMQTSLEQVVDLAVSAVIARRVGGVLPSWLCLDEIFDGQGRITKESAFAVLKEFSHDRLVMVVDHSTEFREAFSQTIKIAFNNGVSRIGP